MIRSIICILLLIPSVCLATDYYIASGGSGESCTSESPCALATALTASTSGDTIYFRSQDIWTGNSIMIAARAGVTYDGSTYGTGTRATLKPSGGSNHVITINVSGVTVKGFELDLNSLAVGGIQTKAAYSDINGTVIDDCVIHSNTGPASGIYSLHVGAADGYKNSNVTITNVTVHDVALTPINIYPTGSDTDNNTVDTVIIRNCLVYNVTAGQAGVAIKNQSKNVTIEFCTVRDNSIPGMELYTNTASAVVAPTDLHIRYNIIARNSVGFLSQNDCLKQASVYIYGNLLFNNGSSGTGEIKLLSDDASPASIYKLFNNTVYSSKSSDELVSIKKYRSAYAAADNYTSPVVTLRNNALYATSTKPLADSFYGSADTVHGHNLIYRPSGVAVSVTDLSPRATANYTDGNLTTWEATAQTTAPVFDGGSLPTGFSGTYGVNLKPNTEYFRIRSGDAIDNGNGTITIDPFNGAINTSGTNLGVTRPRGSGSDIGAYEEFPTESRSTAGIGGSMR